MVSNVHRLVQGAGAARLSSLEQLRQLDLSHSQVDNATVLQLLEGCPHLSTLNVVGSRCTRELHKAVRQYNRPGRNLVLYGV